VEEKKLQRAGSAARDARLELCSRRGHMIGTQNQFPCNASYLSNSQLYNSAPDTYRAGPQHAIPWECEIAEEMKLARGNR
jgi:hypothetical protein